MYFYNMFGLVVMSDREYREVIPIKEQKNIDVSIIKGHIDDSLMPKPEDNEGGCVAYRDAKWTSLKYKSIGAFVIEKGKSIIYRLVDGHNPKFVDRFILCFIVVYIFRQRNIIALHGSCINWRGNALMISGESGSGKSTLTSALILSGNKFTSDDLVAVTVGAGGVLATASYPWRKLDERSLLSYGLDPNDYELVADDNKTKYSVVDIEHFQNTVLPLKCIIVIEPSDVEEVTIEEVVGVGKVKLIEASIYGRPLTDIIPFDETDMVGILEISSMVRVLRLRRPLEGLTVGAQVNAIESYNI